MPKYYELTIIPRNLSDSEKIISSLQIQPTKEQRGPNFLTLEFYLEPEKIEEIEKKLKSEPQITKYLILRKEAAKTEIKVPRRPKIKTFDPNLGRGQKVELGEIDKKLKEIFKEE